MYIYVHIHTNKQKKDRYVNILASKWSLLDVDAETLQHRKFTDGRRKENRNRWAHGAWTVIRLSLDLFDFELRPPHAHTSAFAPAGVTIRWPPSDVYNATSTTTDGRRQRDRRTEVGRRDGRTDRGWRRRQDGTTGQAHNTSTKHQVKTPSASTKYKHQVQAPSTSIYTPKFPIRLGDQDTNANVNRSREGFSGHAQ